MLSSPLPLPHDRMFFVCRAALSGGRFQQKDLTLATLALLQVSALEDGGIGFRPFASIAPAASFSEPVLMPGLQRSILPLLEKTTLGISFIGTAIGQSAEGQAAISRNVTLAIVCTRLD